MEEKKDAETLMQKAEDVKFTAQEDIVRMYETRDVSRDLASNVHYHYIIYLYWFDSYTEYQVVYAWCYLYYMYLHVTEHGFANIVCITSLYIFIDSTLYIK